MCLEGDVILCKCSGVLTVADVHTMQSAMAEQLQPGRTYCIIADVAEVTGMEAEARKMSTDWLSRHDIGGAANFGAGMATRALGALVFSLLRLLHKSTMPAHFAKTEEEARAWV